MRRIIRRVALPIPTLAPPARLVNHRKTPVLWDVSLKRARLIELSNRQAAESLTEFPDRLACNKQQMVCLVSPACRICSFRIMLCVISYAKAEYTSHSQFKN